MANGAAFRKFFHRRKQHLGTDCTKLDDGTTTVPLIN